MARSRRNVSASVRGSAGMGTGSWWQLLLSLVVADIPVRRLLERVVDQLEQSGIVFRKFLARVDVVVDAFVGWRIAVEIRLHAFGPVFALVGRRVGILPQPLIHRSGVTSAEFLIELGIDSVQAVLMDTVAELVNEDILVSVTVPFEVEQVFFTAGSNASAQAACAFVPVIFRLHVPLFWYVSRHLGGRHHHEPTAILDHRPRNVVAVGQHLPNQVPGFGKSFVGDLGRGQNGKSPIIGLLLIEGIEFERLAELVRNRPDDGLWVWCLWRWRLSRLSRQQRRRQCEKGNDGNPAQKRHDTAPVHGGGIKRYRNEYVEQRAGKPRGVPLWSDTNSNRHGNARPFCFRANRGSSPTCLCVACHVHSARARRRDNSRRTAWHHRYAA